MDVLKSAIQFSLLSVFAFCFTEVGLAQAHQGSGQANELSAKNYFGESADSESERMFEEEEFESPFDEPIETERHDFTQSPTVVGRGVRQFEYGILYSYKEDGGEVENTYATPELLFRYGVTDRIELRARFNYAWKQFSDEEDLEGGEDLRLSMKLQVTEACGCRPDSALELRSSAPTGGSDLTTGRWQFGADYIYGWELGEYFGFAASTGVIGNGLGDVAFVEPGLDPNDEWVAWTQSMALSAKLTGRTTGYFEWFGLFTHGKEEELTINYLNFGVDYLINKNVVVDARIGWGLNEDSDDLFAGFGGGFRY